jgi:hypothetical protein
MKTAVGVVYFPNDGIVKGKTDALFYELLENITNFNNLGYNIILMGDFKLYGFSSEFENVSAQPKIETFSDLR